MMMMMILQRKMSSFIRTSTRHLELGCAAAALADEMRHAHRLRQPIRAQLRIPARPTGQNSQSESSIPSQLRPTAMPTVHTPCFISIS
ncbi:unnamed protein product [Leuciscus chuanchicus]